MLADLAPELGMFADLEYDADQVLLKLTVLGHGRVYIDLISVRPEFRGQGVGERTLQMLCERATFWGVTLVLKAVTLNDLITQSALEKWYHRHAFVTTCRDEDRAPTMERAA